MTIESGENKLERVILSSLAKEILGVIERLTSQLSPDSFLIEVMPDRSVPRGGSVIHLDSLRKSGKVARVRIYITDKADIIDVVLGRDLRFEVPVKGGWWSPTGKRSFLEAIGEMCSAAIRGDVKETIWVSGEDIVK